VVVLILGIPLLLVVLSLLVKKEPVFDVLNSIGYFIVFGAAGLLFKHVLSARGAVLAGRIFYVDALSAFFIFVVSVVAFAASLYSIGYIRKDVATGMISAKKARLYYVLFNVFCFSMFFVPAVNNLGLMWVAIEMTTLISAFLVGFYNSKESIEAAWKYIIICSVGIIFALLGTILCFYSFSFAGGLKSLNASDILAGAAHMDKNLLRVAFIFILVGYGTKAGLAPMHTWLPDAHSQAVAPISALLSGVLLKTAVYAILRFGMIVAACVGFSYFSHLMLFLGLVSLAVSCSFILVQKDIKRLLAYSSIEHIGIIAVGVGLGSPWAVAGALLHVLNHAVVKAMMFFGAGRIVSVYKNHRMAAIRGVLKAMPQTAILLFLGMFALTGFPPFSIFVSEILIIIAAFVNGSYLIAALLLFFLAVIFGAFVYHFGSMFLGSLPRDMRPVGEPLSGKLAMAFLFIPAAVLWVAAPWVKEDFLWFAQTLFKR
jgi:hydrogenase-4 component F